MGYVCGTPAVSIGITAVVPASVTQMIHTYSATYNSSLLSPSLLVLLSDPCSLPFYAGRGPMSAGIKLIVPQSRSVQLLSIPYPYSSCSRSFRSTSSSTGLASTGRALACLCRSRTLCIKDAVSSADNPVRSKLRLTLA